MKQIGWLFVGTALWVAGLPLIGAVTPNEFAGSDSERIERAIAKACETGERSIEIPRMNAARKDAVWLIDRAILLPDDFTLRLTDCLVRLAPGVHLFQQELEKKAYSKGEKDYFAPAQRVGDFHEHKKTEKWGKVTPSYKPGVTMSNLWDILPLEVAKTLDEGLAQLDKKIRGFNDPDAVLTAVETRSSSPVRIRRSETGESISVSGIYPTGEGAGYAGGIMSSAIDGIRQAEVLLDKLFS